MRSALLPLLTRHLIVPLHEKLLGRPTLRCLRQLELSQWSAPDDLKRLQTEKLYALLRHAEANTRFYRGRCRTAGVDVRRDDPWTTLARLPLLTRDDIRASAGDMLWHDAPGGLFKHATGGSTGEPLIFHFDRRRQAYDQAARMRTHRWFGVALGDRELFLWGSPIEWRRTDGVKRVRDALFNHRLLSAFDMSAARMDDYLDTIERYRPACLFGYPSSLTLLAEHARHRRRGLRTPRLRAVFVTGEVCDDRQRKTLETCFQVPVADGYGSREAGFIAHQCPAGGRHLTAENVIVEIIDDDGSPRPVGETGEIVVTHLDAFAMPFVRYRTGDVGRLIKGRCRCGRGLPLMDAVQGRTTDFLYLPDGTVKHALSVIYPLRELPGVKQFHVTQQADYSIDVRVVPAATGGPADRGTSITGTSITESSIAARVRPVVGTTVDLRVSLVEAIETAASGKHRQVISHARRAVSPAVGAMARRGCHGQAKRRHVVGSLK